MLASPAGRGHREPRDADVAFAEHAAELPAARPLGHEAGQAQRSRPSQVVFRRRPRSAPGHRLPRNVTIRRTVTPSLEQIAESARPSMPLMASGAEHISASSVPAVSGTELASINTGYLHIRTRRLASRGRRGALCPQGRDPGDTLAAMSTAGKRAATGSAWTRTTRPGIARNSVASGGVLGVAGGVLLARTAAASPSSGPGGPGQWSCPGLSSRSLRARCRDRSRTRSGRCRGEAGSPWH
jgi:hypothetical protein